MPPESPPPNRLFKLVIVVSAAFVLTILLMIVTALSSIESPLVKFFNAYGLPLIGIEVALILASAGAAMWIDGKQTNAAAGSADETLGMDAMNMDAMNCESAEETGEPGPTAATRDTE